MTVTLAATSAQPQATNNEPVRIAVTDRESLLQHINITLLLERENVVIELISSETVGEVRAAIDKGKIDGILLSAWEEQDPQTALVLDQSLLEQNANALRPVPLLAIGESMLSLVNNGRKLLTQPRVGSKTAYSVTFSPGSHLHRWVDMEELWVTTDHPLPGFTIPPDGPAFISNARSHRGGEVHLEGIEVVERGALHVGVGFDPVMLAQPALTEDITLWSLTSLGAWNIIKGFVAEVRNHAANSG